MDKLSSIDLVLSFLITWTVGLAPPLLIRYFNHGEKLSKSAAAITCAILWLGNIALFTALGSTSKFHGALLLIAYVSYVILTRQGKAGSVLSQSKATTWVRSRIKSILTLGGWDRLLTVLVALWVLVTAVAYFVALRGNRSALELFPRNAFGWGADKAAIDKQPMNPFGDPLATISWDSPFPLFSLAGFVAYISLPVLAVVFLRIGFGRAIRWATNGFEGGLRRGWIRTGVVVFGMWGVLVTFVAFVEYSYGGFIFRDEPIFTVFVPIVESGSSWPGTPVIPQISLARLLIYAIGAPAVFLPIAMLLVVLYRWVSAGFVKDKRPE